MPGSVGAAAAAAAYGALSRAPAAATEEGGGFGAALHRAVEGAIRTGQRADEATRAGLLGTGGVTETILAVSRAETALQTAVAVRDRVVAAYQDVMRMPI